MKRTGVQTDFTNTQDLYLAPVRTVRCFVTSETNRIEILPGGPVTTICLYTGAFAIKYVYSYVKFTQLNVHTGISQIY